MVIEPLEAYDALELLPLYAAVGWTNYTARPEMLERAFSGSLCALAARAGGRLAGVVRAVGDGASVLYVQDLLVLPEYQRPAAARAAGALPRRVPDRAADG